MCVLVYKGTFLVMKVDIDVRLCVCLYKSVRVSACGWDQAHTGLEVEVLEHAQDKEHHWWERVALSLTLEHKKTKR